MIDKYFIHPPPKLKPDQKFDPQRRRMYRMEREFDGTTIGTKTDRQTLLDLITHACNKYKVDKPRLVIGHNRKVQELGYQLGDKIWLNGAFYGQNTMTLLHELAHWIAQELFPDSDNHGPEFASIYMHLLDRYRILPAFAYRHLAKRWGIKIARLKNPFTEKCSPE